LLKETKEFKLIPHSHPLITSQMQ